MVSSVHNFLNSEFLFDISHTLSLAKVGLGWMVGSCEPHVDVFLKAKLPVIA